MICPSCGKENAEGTNFCVDCGTKLDGSVQPVQPEAAVENEVPQAAPAETEADSAYDRIEEILQDEPATKKKSLGNIASKVDLGLVKKIGIAAIAVIVLIILISCLRSCSSSGTLDVGNLPLVYGADEEIKFLKVGQKEGSVIDDEDEIASISHISITSDGKYIFYGADPDGNEFDLCYRPVSKKDSNANQKIVSGITDYLITPDGNTIVYIKNNDIYKCSMNGKNPLKLAKDYVDDTFYENDYDYDYHKFDITDDFSAIVYENDEGEIYYSTGVDKIHNKIGDDATRFYFSESGKKIVIVEEDKDKDTNKTYKTVSVCGTGKKDKAKTLESNVSDYIMIDNEFSSMYYVKKDKLYLKDGTKDGSEVEGIEDDVVMISSTTDDKENKYFYAVTLVEKDDKDEYNLYYIDGKKAKLVLEDLCASYYYGTKLINASYYDDDSDEYKEKHYVRAEYDKFVEIDIPEEDGEKVQYYYTENNFYTIENFNDNKMTGDLVKYEITNKGIDFDNGVTIAEDVEGVDTTYAKFFEKETILIKHDDEEYSVYNGGKKATEIKADIYNFLWFSKDGTMFLATDLREKDYTYTLAKFDGKKVVDIADDVEDAVIFDEKTVYYIDGSDDLFFNKGKLNRDTKIDEDVDGMLQPVRYVVSKKGTRADFTIPTLYFYY